ncbi:MAG: CPBP family intramembrane metalloprotease [Deltaproteobacteria bacterium]|nr:CPBP family intramembrane metalloprotease [Deltaproteobacteria bacterium]
MSPLRTGHTTLIATILAFAVFVPLFATGGIGSFDFWWWMSTNAVLMLAYSALSDREWRLGIADDLKDRLLFKLGVGLVSAAFLYLVFYCGNELVRAVLSSAGGDIANVYNYKSGSSPLRVGLLIGLLIGPAEELFWRAFLQRRLEASYGKWAGLALATAAYTGMHLASLNPMLVLAAAVCGVFWGLLYLRLRSIWLNVVSHVAWDLAVFLFFPF